MADPNQEAGGAEKVGTTGRFSERSNERYQEWAADTFTGICRLLDEGEPTNLVLTEVCQRRQSLAKELGDSQADLFGTLRVVEGASTFHKSNYGPVIERANRDMDHYMASQIRDFRPEINPQHAPRLTRQTYYTFLSGEKTEATRLGLYLEPITFCLRPFEAGTLVFEHTALEVHPRVFGDVLERIDLARRRGKRDEESLKQLIHAMYGFYQAMPFRRGSAAIGRSFFDCLFFSCLGIQLPAKKMGPDLFAITAMSQEDYEREILCEINSREN